MTDSQTLQRLRDTPSQAPLGLRAARMHEACGAARISFALFQMARHSRAVFWIAPASQRLQLLPQRLPVGVAERLIFLRTTSEEDLLWSAEEALRAEPTGLVVASPQKPLSLTTGRRLRWQPRRAKRPVFC